MSLICRPWPFPDLKIGRPPVSRRKVNKPNRLRFLEDQKARTESRSLEKFQTRPWQTGDVYAPRDLSPVEMKKWGRRQAPSKDAFDGLNINPLDLYKVGCFAVHALLERSLDKSTDIRLELCCHVRIHLPHGPYQAPKRNRLATCQSTKDREGHSESHWSRPYAICPPPP